MSKDQNFPRLSVSFVIEAKMKAYLVMGASNLCMNLLIFLKYMLHQGKTQNSWGTLRAKWLQHMVTQLPTHFLSASVPIQ